MYPIASVTVYMKNSEFVCYFPALAYMADFSGDKIKTIMDNNKLLLRSILSVLISQKYMIFQLVWH